MTTLSKEEILAEEIKEFYSMRWRIEAFFREAKCVIGLNAVHSKKRRLIQQGIYAVLLLYHFGQCVVAKGKVSKKPKQKHEYQANFTRIFHIVRNFLKKKGGNPL